jgi:hypothetical protein
MRVVNLRVGMLHRQKSQAVVEDGGRRQHDVSVGERCVFKSGKGS